MFWVASCSTYSLWFSNEHCFTIIIDVYVFSLSSFYLSTHFSSSSHTAFLSPLLIGPPRSHKWHMQRHSEWYAQTRMLVRGVVEWQEEVLCTRVNLKKNQFTRTDSTTTNHHSVWVCLYVCACTWVAEEPRTPNMLSICPTTELLLLVLK